MTDTLLIPVQLIRQYTDLNSNIDEKLLVNNIIWSQDEHIQRLLGTVLYTKFLTDAKAGTVTGNYKTLLDGWITPTLIWAVYMESLESIYVRPRNNGLLVPQGGENSDAADHALFSRKVQNAKNKFQYYSEQLARYLISYQGNFPELTTVQFLYQLFPDFGTQFRSPIVFRDNGRGKHFDQSREIGLRISDSRYPWTAYGSNIDWPNTCC